MIEEGQARANAGSSNRAETRFGNEKEENQRNETMEDLRRGGGAHDDHRCLWGQRGIG